VHKEKKTQTKTMQSVATARTVRKVLRKMLSCHFVQNLYCVHAGCGHYESQCWSCAWKGSETVGAGQSCWYFLLTVVYFLLSVW